MRITKRKLYRAGVTTLVAIVVATTAAGCNQANATNAAITNYPGHPITLVVAYSPGGGVDAVARILAQELTRSLKQSIIVDNRPGGGGTIGATLVRRATPDGYTLLLGDPAFAISPSLMSRSPYDLGKDFQTISTVTTSPLVVSVPVTSKITNLTELRASSNQGGKGLSYSSAGFGSSPHMAGELFTLKTKGHFVHVPYKGSGPAMADLVAGQIDFSFSTMAAALPFIKPGKIRALATTGAVRAAELPDVPTVAETVPGFDVRFWTALMAPAQTPPEIVRKLNEATRLALQKEEVKSALRNIGESPAYSSVDESTSFVQKEWRKWRTVVTEGNIRMN